MCMTVMKNNYGTYGLNANGHKAAYGGAWRAAVYCRLSKDDELEGESASIGNQRDMLLAHCERNGWDVVAVFQDDGYTGLNMDRPDLKRLLKAAEQGIINLVITKDLSRLSRNYLEAGKLIEEFFPRYGVRYIALNDNIDTMTDNNDIAPFKNILNEFYSRDISKKVHASYQLKATKGHFTGCLAPFGYRKDPEDKNHLLVDEETAPIVRKIFSWALDGRGPNYICRRLEEEKIPCPTWWNRQRGLRNHYTKWELADPENGRYVWDFTVIKEMLSNPVYVGDIASQKANYRFKLGWLSDKKPDEWLIVENMHEPIVDRESFELIQENVHSRQRPLSDGGYSLFAGLIKCKECGRTMTIRCTNAKVPVRIYACATYNKFGKHHCTQHRVEYDTLYQLVLEKIRECAAEVLENEDEVIERLTASGRQEDDARCNVLSRQLARDEERMEVLEKMVMKLYEDMVAGRISEQNFDLMMGKSQKEQEELKKRISKNREILSNEDRRIRDASAWADCIREYADIEELDSEMLHRLIREITVHEDITEDGERHITIKIYFNLKPIPAKTALPQAE